MKSTGIVRKVDELGRIVLPIELRRTMGIEVKDALEIYVDAIISSSRSTSRPAYSAVTQRTLSTSRVRMSAAIAHMSSVCFKPLHSNTVTLLLFADFPLGKSVFLFFTASLRRFGAVFRLCCSAAAYVPLLLVHLQNGLYALIQLGIQLLQARCDILMYG